MSANVDQQAGVRIYRRLLSHVFPYWKMFLLAIVGMAIYSTNDAGFARLMQPMLDDSFVNQDPQTIKWLPLVIILIFILRVVSGFMSSFGMEWVARHVIRDLRRKMFSQLLELPVSFYDASASGTLISKLLYDVEQLAQASSIVITIFIRDSLTVLALLGLMFYTNSSLAMVFVVMAPFMAIIVVFVSRRFRKLGKRIQNSMGDVSHVTEEAISGNRVIKIFGGQDYEERKFESVNDYNLKQRLKMAATNAFSVPFIQLIVATAFALIVYLATLPALRESISPGTFVSFMTAMIMLMQPIRRLTTVNSQLQQGIAAAQSVFDFLDQNTESDKGKLTVDRVEGKIEFRGVGFSYDVSKGEVLQNIDLTIEPGETVAFVGRSGAGKSTLVSLIPRFYERSSGSILIDGIDIDDISLSRLRQNIALVSQQVTLFNDTIEHNIAYGGLEKSASPERIEWSAKSAHAYEFIEKFPEGLSTLVGEDGVMLSGGQRQRIAIARALLKDAPVLILDEATSALDTESERHIQAGLDALMQNRTTLVIAHRLSTIERADKIVVLDEGNIVEVGNHRELLAKGGVYSSLYRIQFEADQDNQ